MSAVHLEYRMDSAERRRRLYAGDIFFIPATPGSLALVDLARSILEEAFAPHDPRSAHEALPPEDVAARLAALRPRFDHGPEARRHILDMLVEIGFDPERTYFDVPRLRTACPAGFLPPGLDAGWAAHRETWYAAPPCALVWWLPVYPLAVDNCLAIYPHYFDQPVANDSQTYRRADWSPAPPAAGSDGSRSQPHPLEPLRGPAMRYLTPPGSAILFSAAHLHETIANTSAETRCSIDFRTVDFDDMVARRGAPNVDSRATGTTARDFMRATDHAHLPAEVVASYDSGAATGERILYRGDGAGDTETPPEDG